MKCNKEQNKMNTIKKLMFAAVFAGMGLCGLAWAKGVASDPVLEELAKIFDCDNTATVVEPIEDADGELIGRKVVLGQDYGPLAFSNDFGAVTIDLNGWTIKGTNGVNGTATTAGGNGGVAITVAGACGAAAGDTAITVKDDSGVQLWENGPYFAKRNVGATKPEESGYYFWWGDTVGYTQNVAKTGWVSVKDGTTTIQFSESDTTAKRTYDKDIDTLKSEGWIDEDNNLVATNDAATVHLGAPWRMMTKADFDAIVANCETNWVTQNGVQGWLVKGKGGYASKSIFLPVTGFGESTGLVSEKNGDYWSSTADQSQDKFAWYLCFDTSHFYANSGTCKRCNGLPVRAVREAVVEGRPAPGSAAVIAGGNGGNGNPPGQGGEAIVDGSGEKVTVVDPFDLVKKGDDGKVLVSDWAKLQKALTNDAAASLTCEAFEHTYENGTNFVKLLADIVADTNVDTRLLIETNSIAVLDLNGFTLDRGLADIESEDGIGGGYVIKVFGRLTVTDTSDAQDGRITGGNNMTCGGVYITTEEGPGARFVLEAGCICGNVAPEGDSGSGGVYVDGGEFLMLGGSIVDNSGEMAGGVSVLAKSGDVMVELRGGLIAGNTGGVGGVAALMISDPAELKILGNIVITNNSSETYAGGVAGTCLTLGGSPVIRDNCGGILGRNLLILEERQLKMEANGDGAGLMSVESATEPLADGADIWVSAVDSEYAPASAENPMQILTNCTANAAQYFHSEAPGTTVFFRDDALWIGAAPGSVANPWKVGEAGSEDTVQAYTNGTGSVIVTGVGTPKELGKDEEPWFGAQPPITKIIVPVGRVDEFKEKWSSLANLITDGTVEATYFAWNGEEVAGPFTTNAIPVTADMTELNSGWYVVQGRVVIDRTDEEDDYKPGLKVNGDAHLILVDGAELVVTGMNSAAGIEVGVVGSITNSLAIYGQANNTGKLIATSDSAAGIGSQIFEGAGQGILPVDCGVIDIHGGTIVASSKTGAGIGGFADEGHSGDYGGTITIYGGNVTAHGGENAAAIGSGGYYVESTDEPSCRVNIHGGTVIADHIGAKEDSSYAAGIGGGVFRNGGIINIYGGTVRAQTMIGAGIGGGYFGEGATVTVYAGDVEVFSQPIEVALGVFMGASGIGGGASDDGIADPGMFALGPASVGTILVGMDVTGEKTEEVDAADFRGTAENPGWYTNCYVHITAKQLPVAMIVTDDGATTNLYYSVQDAFNSEFTADQSVTNTVTLLRDYTEANKWVHGSIGNLKGAMVLDARRTARIDLNGHTLTGGGTAIEEGSVSAVLLAGTQSVLIIDDSSEAKTGAIRKLAVADNAAPLLAVKSGQLGGVAPMVYYYLPVVLNLGGDLTLANGTIHGAPCSLGSEVLGAIGVGVQQGCFTMTGGEIVDCFVEGVTPSVGIGGVKSELVITGGKVKDAIMFMDAESTASISGGLFGTDDVKNNPAWLAEGCECVTNNAEATYAEGYVWKVRLIPAAGSPENPWNVGADGSEDTVQAYTNGTGVLVVEGEGPVAKTPWLDEDVKDGITEITIRNPDVELPTDAFKDMGTDGDKITLNLPDGWQGDFPNDEGGWYGAKAKIKTWPITIRNLMFRQRYPWNGLVDFLADVTASTNVIFSVRVWDGEEILPVETVVTGLVQLVSGKTRVRIVWNANADLADRLDFRSENIFARVVVRAKPAEEQENPKPDKKAIRLGEKQLIIGADAGPETLDLVPGNIRIARNSEEITVDPGWGGVSIAYVGWPGEAIDRTYTALTTDIWDVAALESGKRYDFSFKADSDPVLTYAAGFWKLGEDWQVLNHENLDGTTRLEDDTTYLVLGETVLEEGARLVVPNGTRFVFEEGSGFHPSEGSEILAPAYAQVTNAETGVVTLKLLPQPVVANLRSLQRYPWNGLVDITFDLSTDQDTEGAPVVAVYNAKLTATVNDAPVPLLTAQTEDGAQLEAGVFRAQTGKVHVIWNADKDLPDKTKGELKVMVNVSVGDL